MARAPQSGSSPDTQSDTQSDPRVEHADVTTHKPEFPSLEGRTPLPEEITGRASGTDEDLVELFVNKSDKHLEDGFRGGSEDETREDKDAPES